MVHWLVRLILEPSPKAILECRQAMNETDFRPDLPACTVPTLIIHGEKDQGQMELVEDYAFLLPINVISEMLGVPQADRAQIRIWSEALASGQGLGKREPEVVAHMRAFGEYTAHLVADKRQQGDRHRRGRGSTQRNGTALDDHPADLCRP